MLLGIILYEGPSQLDGKPIVCIATGFENKSANHKTGEMIQTWILRSDISPEDAANTGEDSSICGDCKLRGIINKFPNGEQANRFRGCYVFVGQAPQQIYGAYKNGVYRGPQNQGDHWRGRMIRFGAYGDPCAVPEAVWHRICADAKGWTGYTHQWKQERFQEYRRFLMASVTTPQEAEQAKQLGWRWFRVAPTGTTPGEGEFHCPASSEQDYRLTCEQCKACDGAGSNAGKASVLIWPHGPPAAIKSYYRIMSGTSPKIDHRIAVNDADKIVLEDLKSSGISSASAIGKRIGKGAQAVATRLWHLRQMGLVKRLGRGEYALANQ